MSVAFAEFTELPDSPYQMWLRGELADWLGLPDGTRVEVIGGDIVVSPMPFFVHNLIVSRIMEAVFVASRRDADVRWEAVQTTDLNLQADESGAVPDLLVLARDRVDHLVKIRGTRWLQAGDVALAVEVTSPSNANSDREPGPQHRTRNGNVIKSKWTSYARSAVGFYLLVDRDPRAARSTLYFDPDPATGCYQDAVSWPFGATISLPEPFNFEIDTAEWTTW